MSIKLIKQKHKWDCGLACLAMVTSKTIEQISKEINRTCLEPGYDQYKKLGIHSSEIEWYLFNHGYRYHTYLTPESYKDYHGFMQARKDNKLYTCELVDVQKFIDRGGTAILSVLSHINSEYLHYIVMHDKKIFDPLPDELNPMKTGDDIEISEAIMIISPKKNPEEV